MVQPTPERGTRFTTAVTCANPDCNADIEFDTDDPFPIGVKVDRGLFLLTCTACRTGQEVDIR